MITKFDQIYKQPSKQLSQNINHIFITLKGITIKEYLETILGKAIKKQLLTW